MYVTAYVTGSGKPVLPMTADLVFHQEHEAT